MIMNTSTAYYSGAEPISNKKFANNQARRHTLYIKDPASAITHFIGAIFSLGASSPLLIKAAQTHQPVNIIAMIIYSISLVALYSASTAYHTIPAGHPYEETLKKLDHMMIFVLIPGIFCGLWADLSMCLSLFIQNKFVIIIVPYLFLFFEKAFFDTIFSNRISLELSPFYFMRGGVSSNIYIVAAILAVMFIVSLAITWIRGKNDDVF